MNRKKQNHRYFKVLSPSSPPYSNSEPANSLHSNTSSTRPIEGTYGSVSETNFGFNSSCPQTKFENYNSRYKQCLPFPPPDKQSNYRTNMSQPRNASQTSFRNSNPGDYHFPSFEFESRNRNEASAHLQKNQTPLLPTPGSTNFHPKHSQTSHKTHSKHLNIPQLMSLNTEVNVYDKASSQNSPNEDLLTSTQFSQLRTSTESFKEFRKDNLIRKPYLEDSNYYNRSEPIDNIMFKGHNSSDDLPSLIEYLEKEASVSRSSLNRNFHHREKYNEREIRKYDDRELEKYNDREIGKYDDRERSPIRRSNSLYMDHQFPVSENGSRRNVQFAEYLTNRHMPSSKFDDCSSLPSRQGHTSHSRLTNQMSNSKRKIPLLPSPFVRVNDDDCFEKDTYFPECDLPKQLDIKKFEQKRSSMDKEIRSDEEDLRVQLLRLKQEKIEERLRELDRKSYKTSKQLSLLKNKHSLF